MMDTMEETSKDNGINEVPVEADEAETPVNTENSKKNYPTQLALTIRILVGAYVTYLAYQVATSKDTVTTPMWIAVAIFIIAGVGLIVTSVKHLACGEYEGGRKDA